MTSKELTALQDQISDEGVVAKKYRTMAKQCTDPTIKKKFESIATRHQRHFDTLMSHLKP
ncbi:MAG: ferritin-like domain-containing protein [Oscillospiraceae bacterium]|nr:ferritin-like domain-containing protein [Oscillospiraceae bacterium]